MTQSHTNRLSATRANFTPNQLPDDNQPNSRDDRQSKTSKEVSMTSEQIAHLAKESLADMKAKEVVDLDVKALTSMTDTIFIASGTSSRHVKAIAESVALDAKKAGIQVLGVEGLEAGEWVLIDLGDVVVHVMLPETRTFYMLEKLWQVAPAEETEA